MLARLVGLGPVSVTGDVEAELDPRDFRRLDFGLEPEEFELKAWSFDPKAPRFMIEAGVTGFILWLDVGRDEFGLGGGSIMEPPPPPIPMFIPVSPFEFALRSTGEGESPIGPMAACTDECIRGVDPVDRVPRVDLFNEFGLVVVPLLDPDAFWAKFTEECFFRDICGSCESAS